MIHNVNSDKIDHMQAALAHLTAELSDSPDLARQVKYELMLGESSTDDFARLARLIDGYVNLAYGLAQGLAAQRGTTADVVLQEYGAYLADKSSG